MFTDVNVLIPIGTVMVMAGWIVTVVVWEYMSTAQKTEGKGQY